MSASEHILRNLIKIVAILLAGVLLFIIGSMIGFGVVGDGNPFSVLLPGVWRHILEFMQ
ncbi:MULTISPECIES: DNA-directed RNA polymerase subunit beta [Enterococcus]|uniref:DNA-directed RNA polymerase subunit beta n=1 Tax=Enterococcus alishanensis TaxID=1303817 RepID=A0ABS6T7I1_9ENTE|nr:DNA-directed RNA polymerase subunit beta [Enterococcus alishanensis]MBV7389102.1 DNA-directed RNA polymerase subunit beta [Enterococcus alishanensis]